MSMEAAGAALPANTKQVVSLFVEAARSAFGPELRSVVLFGSAAEGRLRATSDINLLLVLRSFKRLAVDGLREPLRSAAAAVRLSPMFLLESELPAAAEAFASKFADMRRRHTVLFGDDPIAGLVVPRPAQIARLKQELLNLAVRFRVQYATRSLREEQLALVVADAAGPLRSAAASLSELAGEPSDSPKAALERVAATLTDDGCRDALLRLSEAREKQILPKGAAGSTLFRFMELTERMRARVDSLA